MKKIISLLLSFYLLMLIVSISAAQSDSITKLKIKIMPEKAGRVNDSTALPDIAHKPFHIDSVDTENLDIIAELNAGWKYKEIKFDKDKNGYITVLTVKAEKLDKSTLVDSLKISEVFFLSDIADSLINWVEITNISTKEINLKDFMLETSEGNFAIGDDVLIKPDNCVVLKDTADLIFNKSKDYITLADTSNAIVSSFAWDSAIMNFPADSIFSLEIIDVLKKSDNPENWNIVYGSGRPGYLPVKYAESIKEQSIWIWLRYVLWGTAGLIFILVIILTFKKKKK